MRWGRSSLALILLIAIIALPAEAQAKEEAESKATAGALTIMEGLNHLKKNGPGKTSGVLLTAGTRSLQNAWIQEYRENQDGPYRLRIKKDLARSDDGKTILRDFTRQYKQDADTVLGSLLNTGGTAGDISILVRSVDPGSIKESVAEAQKLSPSERAEELAASRAYPVLQAAGLDMVIVPAASTNSATIASGPSFSPNTREKPKPPRNQLEKKPVAELNVAGYRLKNDPSSRAPSSFAKTSPAGAIANDQGLSPASGPAKPVKGKLGINFGIYSTQAIIDAVGDLGSWYYTYSPHPNRADKNTTYETVTWANRYQKEFVPMITETWFKYGPGPGSCTLIEEFAHKGAGETICDVNKMADTLIGIKKLFSPTNQPRYLFTFNEPYQKGADSTLRAAGVYGMDPSLAAKAFAKIEKAARLANLKLISPSLSTGEAPVNWMATFLKSCYDNRNDPSFPCDIHQIYAFQIHAYQCDSGFWENNFGQGTLKKEVLAKLNGYKGVNWRKFLEARSAWVSETNCNWDPDFQEAQSKGKYIRNPEETCRRATGQKPGWGNGSLSTMIHLPNAKLERFAWWNTYADPARNSDVGRVNLSSENRIEAARLLDDAGHWTPPGRAYLQAYADSSELSSVDCGETPSVVTGLFQTPSGGIYLGFKDFYCKYDSMEAVTSIYGPAWQQLARKVSALPTRMVDEKSCGAQQGIYRQGRDIFYTFEKGYTCWINSPAKLGSWGGIKDGNILPETDMKARGLDARAVTAKICR